MCGKDSVFKQTSGLGSLMGIVMAMALCSAVAAAEPGEASPDANQGAVTPAVGPEQAHTKVEGGRARLIAFEKNTPTKDGLRILAALYEKNIVPWGKIEGTLNFTTLRDVTFEEAMEAVLGGAFVYQKEGQLIKVYAKEEYKKVQEEAKKTREEADLRHKKEMEDPNRMVCRVFTLYYISAAEAGPLVQSVLSANGILKASTRAQTGTPAGQSAGSSGSGAGQSIGSSSGGGDSMALNDTLVVKDYPENVKLVEGVLKDLDVRPKQVLVEATILSARLTDSTQFGIKWDTLGGISSPDANLVGGGVKMDGGLNIGISHANVGVFIQALEGITDVTLLANPKILAMNKQLGEVYIGTKLGYRDQATVSSGLATAGEVKFLDTGTKLSFRPYIGNDGYIRMDIHPKDSSGDLINDGTGAKIPNETAVELASNIMVKDGQTIVIGGLFRNKTTKSKGQVPLLGSLPVLGTAFRSTTDTVERQEVIVLLTPHILNEPDAAAGKKAQEDVDRMSAGVKDSWMPIDYVRLTEEAYAKAARCYLEGDKEQSLRHLRNVLTLRPTHVEAIRLKERILSECSPEEYQKLERIVLEEVAARTAAEN